MKHIKLFENWAEELEVPWYLDPSKKEEIIKRDGTKTYHVLSDRIQALIKNSEHGSLDLSSVNFGDDEKNVVNFKSFSDYDCWLEEYYDIRIGQLYAKYQLSDCRGIPQIKNKLTLYSNEIRSLNGLENHSFNRLEIYETFIENLKYCPKLRELEFENSPLLSFYGTPTNVIRSWSKSMCGKETYNTIVDGKNEFYIDVSLKELKDLQFNANVFSNFNKECSDSTHVSRVTKPWELIYNDPNDVENYDFLFLPFWQSSEVFRDKAKIMIDNLDMSAITRSDEELW